MTNGEAKDIDDFLSMLSDEMVTEEVRAKIDEMEQVLADAVRRCDAGEAPGCPLIDTLWRSAP